MERYNKNIGDFGEEYAQKYLEDMGYKILTQNYNCRFGEIDIVAIDNNCLVFIGLLILVFFLRKCPHAHFAIFAIK